MLLTLTHIHPCRIHLGRIHIYLTALYRHAAASYGHIELLEYLVSKGRFLHKISIISLTLEIGGDVNVADEDGDTPIYTAESLEVAKWLIDHGAIVDRANAEGMSVR
jgi:uncharacterized protein